MSAAPSPAPTTVPPRDMDEYARQVAAQLLGPAVAPTVAPPPFTTAPPYVTVTPASPRPTRGTPAGPSSRPTRSPTPSSRPTAGPATQGPGAQGMAPGVQLGGAKIKGPPTKDKLIAMAQENARQMTLHLKARYASHPNTKTYVKNFREVRSLPDYTKDLYGMYSSDTKRVEISAYEQGKQLRTAGSVNNTLVHELAHAVTINERAEHGPRWRDAFLWLANIAAKDLRWTVEVMCHYCKQYKVCKIGECSQCVWECGRKAHQVDSAAEAVVFEPPYDTSEPMGPQPTAPPPSQRPPKSKPPKSKRPPKGKGKAWREDMLAAVNAERAKAGLAALCLNDKLSKAAQDHIEWKVATKFATDPHIGEGGSKAWDRARQAGYKDGFIGENIVAGIASIPEAMRVWMDSPPHRANILRDGFVHLGVGRTADGRFWATEFGSSASERCAPQSSKS